MQQVVEIGVRGLASGTNDPFTAVGAVDALSGALVPLFTRPGPHTRYEDDEGEVRLLIDWPRPEELLAQSMRAFRQYGMDHADVVTAVVRLLVRLEPVANGPARSRLAEEVTAFTAAYGASASSAIDSNATEETLRRLAHRLRLA
ncbi:DUF2254 family protein [Clavibacter sp. km1a]|uniref:DUF2254 family protein n=1 Tax=Clavibacter sp. km1a TaxID=3459136 RepID=UPI004042A6AE